MGSLMRFGSVSRDSSMSSINSSSCAVPTMILIRLNSRRSSLFTARRMLSLMTLLIFCEFMTKSISSRAKSDRSCRSTRAQSFMASQEKVRFDPKSSRDARKGIAPPGALKGPTQVALQGAGPRPHFRGPKGGPFRGLFGPCGWGARARPWLC